MFKYFPPNSARSWLLDSVTSLVHVLATDLLQVVPRNRNITDVHDITQPGKHLACKEDWPTRAKMFTCIEIFTQVNYNNSCESAVKCQFVAVSRSHAFASSRALFFWALQQSWARVVASQGFSGRVGRLEWTARNVVKWIKFGSFSFISKIQEKNGSDRATRTLTFEALVLRWLNTKHTFYTIPLKSICEVVFTKWAFPWLRRISNAT